MTTLEFDVADGAVLVKRCNTNSASSIINAGYIPRDHIGTEEQWQELQSQLQYNDEMDGKDDYSSLRQQQLNESNSRDNDNNCNYNDSNNNDNNHDEVDDGDDNDDDDNEFEMQKVNLTRLSLPVPQVKNGISPPQHIAISKDNLNIDIKSKSGDLDPTEDNFYIMDDNRSNATSENLHEDDEDHTSFGADDELKKLVNSENISFQNHWDMSQQQPQQNTLTHRHLEMTQQLYSMHRMGMVEDDSSDIDGDADADSPHELINASGDDQSEPITHYTICSDTTTQSDETWSQSAPCNNQQPKGKLEMLNEALQQVEEMREFMKSLTTIDSNVESMLENKWANLMEHIELNSSDAPYEGVIATPLQSDEYPIKNKASAQITITPTPKINQEISDKCPMCTKVVYNREEIKACNAVWHTSCFQCGGPYGGGCKKVLTRGNYTDYKGMIPYCKHCYSNSFGPTGFGITGVSTVKSINPLPISNTDITCNNVSFHPYTSSKIDLARSYATTPPPAPPLPNTPTNQISPKIAAISNNILSNLCPVCDQTVYKREEIRACSAVWHSTCFKCGGGTEDGCKRVLTRDNYVDAKGKTPFCKHCYSKLYGPKGFGMNGVSNFTASAPSTPQTVLRESTLPSATVVSGNATIVEDSNLTPKQYQQLRQKQQDDSKAKERENSRSPVPRDNTRSPVPKANAQAVLESTSSLTSPTPSSARKFRFGGPAEKCPVCAQSVFKKEEVKACNNVWHTHCFKCGGTQGGGCGRVLTRDNYVDYKGQTPFCKYCYGKLYGPTGFGVSMAQTLTPTTTTPVSTARPQITPKSISPVPTPSKYLLTPSAQLSSVANSITPDTAASQAASIDVRTPSNHHTLRAIAALKARRRKLFEMKCFMKTIDPNHPNIDTIFEEQWAVYEQLKAV